MRTTILAVLCTVSLLTGRVCGDPPGPPGEHELRTLSVGTKTYLLRFKPKSGEAWTSSGSKWQAVTEDVVPAAGAYDITLMPTELGFTAVRMERHTGQTWILRNGKWNMIEEPESKPVP